MTLDSVGKLLARICVHWPAQKKNILDANNRISRTVAEEWYNRLGFLEDDAVDGMLEEYLLDDSVNRYAPNVAYFLGHKKQKKSSAYYDWESRKQNRYRINKWGDLVDQEDRIYADPDDPDGAWSVNDNGYICKRSSGREEVWFR